MKLMKAVWEDRFGFEPIGVVYQYPLVTKSMTVYDLQLYQY